VTAAVRAALRAPRRDAEATMLRARLVNQRLVGSAFRTAAEVVAWMGAVQAQEYLPAKYALGLRAPGLTDAAVEQASAEGAILRTHVLRPTWHFVTPRDIRWMLALTAPRINARMAPYNRQLELDARLLARSNDVIARALEGGRHLTRAELAAALSRAGIPAGTQRLGHLTLQAEIDRVVCSGPRRGTQVTYALFDERVPPGRAMDRDEALAALASRYLASHGPATLRDFSWWSGLPMADARRAFAAASPAARSETIGGLTFWSVPNGPRPGPSRSTTWLLPIYDEYLIAYTDRDVAIDPVARALDPSRRDDRGHYLVADRRFAGNWRWLAEQGRNVVRVMPYRRLTAADDRAIRAASRQLAAFMGQQVEVVVTARGRERRSVGRSFTQSIVRRSR
jgi:hypothetical protein